VAAVAPTSTFDERLERERLAVVWLERQHHVGEAIVGRENDAYTCEGECTRLSRS